MRLILKIGLVTLLTIFCRPVKWYSLDEPILAVFINVIWNITWPTYREWPYKETKTTMAFTNGYLAHYSPLVHVMFGIIQPNPHLKSISLFAPLKNVLHWKTQFKSFQLKINKLLGVFLATDAFSELWWAELMYNVCYVSENHFRAKILN